MVGCCVESLVSASPCRSSQKSLLRRRLRRPWRWYRRRLHIGACRIPPTSPRPVRRCRIPPQKLPVGPQRRCLVGCLVLPHVDCPKQKRCASTLLLGMWSIWRPAATTGEGNHSAPCPQGTGKTGATGSSEQGEGDAQAIRHPMLVGNGRSRGRDANQPRC